MRRKKRDLILSKSTINVILSGVKPAKGGRNGTKNLVCALELNIPTPLADSSPDKKHPDQNDKGIKNIISFHL